MGVWKYSFFNYLKNTLYVLNRVWSVVKVDRTSTITPGYAQSTSRKADLPELFFRNSLPHIPAYCDGCSELGKLRPDKILK